MRAGRDEATRAAFARGLGLAADQVIGHLAALVTFLLDGADEARASLPTP